MLSYLVVHRKYDWYEFDEVLHSFDSEADAIVWAKQYVADRIVKHSTYGHLPILQYVNRGPRNTKLKEKQTEHLYIMKVPRN